MKNLTISFSLAGFPVLRRPGALPQRKGRPHIRPPVRPEQGEVEEHEDETDADLHLGEDEDDVPHRSGHQQIHDRRHGELRPTRDGYRHERCEGKRKFRERDLSKL